MGSAAPTRRPRVVIVGAGFGGLAAARALRRAPVEVLLVDRVNYHTFQPLLYQVATAGLEPEEIAHAVRGILRGQTNFAFRVGTVSGVEWDRREVLLQDGGRIAFDYLILAAGAVTADYGIPGVREHGLGLKHLSDAINLRAHVLEQFEAVARETSLPQRGALIEQAALLDRGALTFVIAGGGPSGVEMAGAMVELIDKVLQRDYPRIDLSRARVVLLEREPRLLAPFHASSQAYALEELRRRGVEVRLSTAVAHVTGEEVLLQGGERIATRTLLWAAGVRANPMAEHLGLEQTRGGRVVVLEDLSVPGHPEAFAIGDLAASRGTAGAPLTDDPATELLPQLAPVAIQGGAHAAAMIRRRLSGDPGIPFVYKDRGIMATIGRNAAVAELGGGLRLRGRMGWISWLALHLVQLIGFRNRAIVLFNWAWSYFTYERGARLILRVADEEKRG